MCNPPFFLVVVGGGIWCVAAQAYGCTWQSLLCGPASDAQVSTLLQNNNCFERNNMVYYTTTC
jgi:hypothetical protein